MSHILNQSYLLIGKTGSGKTYSSKKILETTFKHIPMENRFLISPSATSSMDTTLLPYFDEENISNVFEEEYLTDILIPMIISERKDVKEKYNYEYIDGVKTKVKRKYKLKYPEYLVFVDDCIENLSSSGKVKGLSSFITRARHVGCHLIITSQYYRSVSNVLRTNAKNFHIFTTNALEVKKLYDEHSGIFDNFKDFKHYFNDMTEEQYSYFIINYNYSGSKVFDDNKMTPLEHMNKNKNNEKGEHENTSTLHERYIKLQKEFRELQKITEKLQK